jgi:hypothetical protein
MKAEIAKIVRDLAGSDYLYFDSPLMVKMNPHDHNNVTFWAVCASPDDRVFVMDAGEQWYELEAREQALINTLYQRVRFMEHKLKTA